MRTVIMIVAAVALSGCKSHKRPKACGDVVVMLGDPYKPRGSASDVDGLSRSQESEVEDIISAYESYIEEQKRSLDKTFAGGMALYNEVCKE